jgi:hypothetical protein
VAGRVAASTIPGRNRRRSGQASPESLAFTNRVLSALGVHGGRCHYTLKVTAEGAEDITS